MSVSFSSHHSNSNGIDLHISFDIWVFELVCPSCPFIFLNNLSQEVNYVTAASGQPLASPTVTLNLRILFAQQK